METTVGVNSPQAVKRLSTALAVDFAKQLWWKKFIGTSENSIVQEKVEMKKDAGDRVVFDLSMRLRGKPVYGDNRAQGKEEKLDFLQDEIIIDQMRKPVSGGGRMTRQRTLHNLRQITKDRAATYCAEWLDEVMFVYASGDASNTSMNEDSIFGDEDFAGNPIEAPDNAHVTYAGDATGKADLSADDKMSVDLIERAATKAKMLNATNPDVVAMQPVRIEGEEHLVTVMSPFQSHDMRRSTGAAEWLEIQKAAGQRGVMNQIFKGKLGMIANTVLQEHANVRRFGDYGAGGNVSAARALLLGRQALTIAFGRGSGSRMSWVEEKFDYGNQIAIAAGMIVGVKKTRFKRPGGTGTDFGVMALDTASKAIA